MALVITHATPADGTFSASGSTNWNANHTLTGIATAAQGGTNSAFFQVAGPTVARTYTFPDANATIAVGSLAQYQIAVGDSSGAISGSANLTFGGSTAGTGVSIAAGTATTDVQMASFTQTLNAAGVTYSGAFKIAITDTASAADSTLFAIFGGSASTTAKFSVNKSGVVKFCGTAGAQGFIAGGAFNDQLHFLGASGGIAGNFFMDNTPSLVSRAAGIIGWTSSTTDASNARDTAFSRISAGLIGVGTGAQGSVAGTLRATLFDVNSGGSTTISTGVGTIHMSSTNIATNAAWIPISYAGTTYFVPAWTTNSP